MNEDSRHVNPSHARPFTAHPTTTHPPYSNKEAIAVNQAWAGHPGYQVRMFSPSNSTDEGETESAWEYKIQIWAKPVDEATGAVAVLVLSSTSYASSYAVELDLNEIGFGLDASSTVSVRDIWAQEDLESATTGSYTTPEIAGHDSGFYL